MPEASPFSDQDLQRAIARALRLLVVLTLAGAGLAGWKMGRPSALLLVVGAVISGSGLWEWLRVMTAVAERMDGGLAPRPLGAVLVGFFVRLALAIAVLYLSLRFVHGSVYALAAGLALGIVALSVEALRLVKAWTA